MKSSRGAVNSIAANEEFRELCIQHRSGGAPLEHLPPVDLGIERGRVRSGPTSHGSPSSGGWIGPPAAKQTPTVTGASPAAAVAGKPAVAAGSRRGTSPL